MFIYTKIKADMPSESATKVIQVSPAVPTSQKTILRIESLRTNYRFRIGTN